MLYGAVHFISKHKLQKKQLWHIRSILQKYFAVEVTVIAQKET